jgi:hypothetical protein
MGDFGLKISKVGTDVTSTSLTNLVVDDVYAFPKCDLRANPKNYGLINFTIASVPAYSGGQPGQVTIYQQAHGGNYIPSFLTAWSFPAGTANSSIYPTSASTFGIGVIDASLGSGILIDMYTDNLNFYIVALNYQNSAITNVTGSIRFYLFADDFSDTP